LFGVGHPGDEIGIVDDRRTPPELHPLARGVVHQKQEGAAVLGEIAGRDQLLVAGVLGKAERDGIDHLDESGRSASVLDVGLAVGACGCEIGRIAGGDEPCKVDGHLARVSGVFETRREIAHAVFLLRRLDGRREGDVGQGAHELSPLR